MKYVDLYGKTIFNRLQIPDVLTDLKCMMGAVSDIKVQNHMSEIVQLVILANGKPHVYVRSSGD